MAENEKISKPCNDYEEIIYKSRKNRINDLLVTKINDFIAKIEPQMESEEIVNKLPKMCDENGNSLPIIDPEKSRVIIQQNVQELAKLHHLHEDINQIWHQRKHTLNLGNVNHPANSNKTKK